MSNKSCAKTYFLNLFLCLYRYLYFCVLVFTRIIFAFFVTVRTFSEEWPSSGESKNDDDERSSQAPSRSPKEKDSGKDKEKDLESKS
jgi:hypothetical protein